MCQGWLFLGRNIRADDPLTSLIMGSRSQLERLLPVLVEVIHITRPVRTDSTVHDTDQFVKTAIDVPRKDDRTAVFCRKDR